MVSIRVISILFVLFIFLRCIKSFEFPKGFELCHRSDDDCIVRRANEIINNHPHGYPELLLDDFEPFRLNKIEIKGNPNSPINFNLKMTDLAMHGYSNLTFTKLTGFAKDPSKIKIETESVNRVVIMKGNYKISGKLLVLPITGEGASEITIYGLKVKTREKPSFRKEDGKTYLKTDNYRIHVVADNMKIHMTNLFNGDKVLSENMLQIMNENWKLLWDEMYGAFNQEIVAATTKILDRIYSNIPYEDMFLPD